MEPLEDPGTGTALSTEFAVGLVADAVTAYEFAAHAVSKLDGSDLPRSNSLAPAPLAAEILHWMRLERERQRERDQPSYDVSIQTLPCSGAGAVPAVGEDASQWLRENLGSDKIDSFALGALAYARTLSEEKHDLRADRAATAAENSRPDLPFKIRPCSGADQSFGVISDATPAEQVALPLTDQVAREQVLEDMRQRYRNLRAGRAATEEDIRAGARARKHEHNDQRATEDKPK